MVRRITASDVAQAAGVSKTTVSYVMNSTPHQSIPEETRERVLAAARELNYTPSSVARALRKGRSDTVLLVLPDWTLGRVLSEVIDELTTELERAGLSLMTRRDREGYSVAAMAREISPAAVIAFHDLDRDEQTFMRESGIYVATALLVSNRSASGTFVLPQELIGSLQVEHLAATGRHRIGYAALDDERITAIQDLRIAGVRRACAEFRLDDPPVITMNPTLDDARTTIRAWQSSGEVDAIAAFNDDLAVALLAGLRAEGLTAPTNFAVIGVDDEPLARFAYPPLTTVKQDAHVIARELARIAIAGIGGQPVLWTNTEMITLIIREST